MEKRRVIIAGIGTEIGKTITSAIVCEALKADYWKPIQAGELEDSDTLKVKSLISNSKTVFHPESYALKTPMSPHEAARIDSIEINLEDFLIPKTNNHLVIEMAGGLLVPLNRTDLFIDFVQRHNLEVILVSQYYLGSINHTLLSLEALKSRNIPITGIIFNGKKVPSTFNIIMEHSPSPCLLELDQEKHISSEVIKKYASRLHI